MRLPDNWRLASATRSGRESPSAVPGRRGRSPGGAGPITASARPDRITGRAKATAGRGTKPTGPQARMHEPRATVTATAPAVGPPMGKEESCAFHV
jgi:hypothetical protein